MAFRCLFRKLRAMSEPVDRAFILRRLDPEDRGQKAALARAMGIGADKLSKVLSGARRIQASEVPAIVAFFSATPPAPGFAEQAATPVPRDGAAHLWLLLRALAPGFDRLEAFYIRESAPLFGLLRGDVVAVDVTRTEPDAGELIWINGAQPGTGSAPARLVGGRIVFADPAEPPADPGAEWAILGVIVAQARGPAITPPPAA